MAKKILRILNRLLNTMIAIVLVLAVLYSVYSLWDNYQFYQGIKDLQVKLLDLKSKGNKPSFEELRKINPDVVAWITLDGTKIDEPIVQGADNLEYLNKDVYGKYSLGGTVFLDSRCNKNFQDPYSIVYGHYMEKHLMFGDLELYQKSSFADKHHTGTLMIPGKKYPLKIFATMVIKSTDPYIFDPSEYKINKETFLSYIKTKSIWTQEDLIQTLENDGTKYSIVALSTGSTKQVDDRTVVLAMYQK